MAARRSTSGRRRGSVGGRSPGCGALGCLGGGGLSCSLQKLRKERLPNRVAVHTGTDLRLGHLLVQHLVDRLPKGTREEIVRALRADGPELAACMKVPSFAGTLVVHV